MTIQEAIEKVIEGGYLKQRVEDLAVHVQAQYFLDTTFWETLVRTDSPRLVVKSQPIDIAGVIL